MKEINRGIYKNGIKDDYTTYINVIENFCGLTLEKFSNFIEELKNEHGKDCFVDISDDSSGDIFECELSRSATEEEIRKYEETQKQILNENLVRERAEYERLKVKFEGNKG
jgi:hypothetical protein